MFEQTFIKAETSDKKRYTMLLSLVLQVATLTVLIIVPLIYTQVLPQAQLRTVFAAPLPPPPSMPILKTPMSERTVSNRPVFRDFLPSLRLPNPRVWEEAKNLGAAPAISDGVPGGDIDSTGSIQMIPVKPPDAPATPVSKPGQNKRVRVASMEASQLIHKVQPAYPQIAKQVHVQGVVEFTAVISKGGTIENLQLVSGHPLLVPAAREAILQWRYKPTLLNGEPVEVITNIVVNFTLNEQ